MSEALRCSHCGALKGSPPGADHPRAKLDEDQVRDIRRRAADGEMGTELAASYGIAKETVYNIIKRRTWKHI